MLHPPLWPDTIALDEAGRLCLAGMCLASLGVNSSAKVGECEHDRPSWDDPRMEGYCKTEL